MSSATILLDSDQHMSYHPAHMRNPTCDFLNLIKGSIFLKNRDILLSKKV